MELPINKILQGDAREWLKKLPKQSVHCFVTSPPYWGLRDYGVTPTKWPAVRYTIFGKVHRIPAMECCLGLEPTPEAFVGHIVLIFREAYKVLRDDGTLWLNFGDSYASTSKDKTDVQQTKGSTLQGGKASQIQTKKQPNKVVGLLKPKDLVGIPWMVAFALRDDGWYLRQDDIWHKPNPMPESVKDRCTKAHEYIFQLSKSEKYFFDAVAIKVPLATASVARLQQDIASQRGSDRVPGKNNGAMKAVGAVVGEKKHKNILDKGLTVQGLHRTRNEHGQEWENADGFANKKSVWTVTTRPFAEAHFATFPPELITDCIKAGTSEYGCCKACGAPYKRVYENVLTPGPKAAKTNVVDSRDIVADKQDQGSNRQKDGHLPGHFNEAVTTGWDKTCKCKTDEVVPAVVGDMFSGAGTTDITARKLNRDTVVIELNPKYIEIHERRKRNELGLFA